MYGENNRTDVYDKVVKKTSDTMLEYMSSYVYTGKGQKVSKSVISVQVHPSVTEIEGNAFKGCKKLKKVVFNAGLQKIEENAFYGCELLGNITLPSTVTEIGRSAFEECSSLRVVVLNEGLTKIDRWAFDSCKSLVSINLPSTLDEVGLNPFRNCNNLKEIVLHEKINYRREWTSRIRVSWLERFQFTGISIRLENIIKTGHYPRVNEAADQIENSQLLHWRENKLFIYPETIMEESWSRIKQRLDSIVQLVTYYEMKQATTTFELALWKMKIEQAWESYDVITKERNEYCIEVPGPVKDSILQFAYPTLWDAGNDNDSVSDDESINDDAAALAAHHNIISTLLAPTMPLLTSTINHNHEYNI